MSGANTFKILIADDNVVNRRVLQELLKIRGYSVHAVNDGAEVIPALESGSFDLVILDCLMPGMDGYTTSREIRAADPSRLNPDVPILAVTALASDGDRRKCLQAGMNDYISKPILADTLYRHVEVLLGQGGGVGSEAAGERGPNGAGRSAAPHGSRKASGALGEVFRTLSARLEQDLVSWQEELQRLIERGAYAEIRFLAHKIRGTADLMALQELSRLTAELERAADRARAGQAKALVPKVIDSLKQLREAVGDGR